MKGKFKWLLVGLLLIISCSCMVFAFGCGDSSDSEHTVGFTNVKCTIYVHTYSNSTRKLYITEDEYESYTAYLDYKPQRYGWIYNGLYDGEGTQYVDEDGNILIRFSTDITLYESWTEIGAGDEYEMGFDIGDYDTTWPQAITVKVGEKIQNFPEMGEIENYTFEGWYYKNADGTKVFYTSGNKFISGYEEFHLTNYYADSDNMRVVLYASYLGDEYTISFDSNDGESVYDIKVNYGSMYNAPVPYYKGHKFLGWFSGTDSNAVRYTDDKGACIKESGFVADTTMYAKWGLGEYVVTYKTYGETSSFTTQRYYYLDTVVEPTSKPKANDKYFAGWYTDEECTEAYVFGQEIEEDFTLYAKWIQSTAITTADGLKQMEANPEGNFHLEKNIDMNYYSWTTIAEFNGIFDGNGYTISNLIFQTVTDNYLGLFGVNNGEISDLTLSGISVSINKTTANSSYYGILVGENSGTIKNCSVKDISANVEFVYNKGGAYNGRVLGLGGLVGVNETEGTVTNCSATVSMTVVAKLSNGKDAGTTANGRFAVGGLVGDNNGLIENCSTEKFTSEVKAYASGSHTNMNMGNDTIAANTVNHGGLVGRNDGEVNNCGVDLANVSTLYGGVNGYNNVGTVILGTITSNAGNFIGYNGGTITQSYANESHATSSGNTICLGGFVGVQASGAKIFNSYAYYDNVFLVDGGTETSIKVGGFVGDNAGTITYAYCKTGIIINRTSATNIIMGGFVGYTSLEGILIKDLSLSGLSIDSETDFYTFGMFAGDDKGSVVNNCYYQHITAGYPTTGKNQTAVELTVDCETGTAIESGLNLSAIYSFVTSSPMNWSKDIWKLTGSSEFDWELVLAWQV